MKIGDKVKITKKSANELSLSSDEAYTVIDILENEFEFPIVLKCDKYGTGWVEFFNEDEIEPIKINGILKAIEEKKEFLEHFSNGGSIDGFKPSGDRNTVIPN